MNDYLRWIPGRIYWRDAQPMMDWVHLGARRLTDPFFAQTLNACVGRLPVMHMLVRSAFGAGEAGNFPASIKTVAEWFPKRERALATGIFNSGSNFGAMIAALFVPWCLTYFGYERGWKLAYIITGAAGFLWLIFWFWLYDTPGQSRRLSPAEYDYIHSDRDETGPEP